MPWLVGTNDRRPARAGRARVSTTHCRVSNARFQSSTHDLTSQLRMTTDAPFATTSPCVALDARHARSRPCGDRSAQRSAARWICVHVEPTLARRSEARLRRSRAAVRATRQRVARTGVGVGAFGDVDRAGHARNRSRRSRRASRPAAHAQLPALHSHGAARQGRAVQRALQLSGMHASHDDPSANWKDQFQDAPFIGARAGHIVISMPRDAQRCSEKALQTTSFETARQSWRVK